MTYNRNQVRPLVTDAEYKLFLSSLSDFHDDLDDKELRATIQRARRARDKYRDLAKRQNRSTAKRSGGRAAAHTANERTGAKAQIFGEALGRLEREEDRRAAAATAAKRKAALKEKKRDTGPKAGNRASRRAKSGGKGGTADKFMSSSAQGSNQDAIRAPQTRINASRAASGRRRQAKRDS